MADNKNVDYKLDYLNNMGKIYDFKRVLDSVCDWRKQEPVPIRIVVFGKAGSGKSSFINSVYWVVNCKDPRNPEMFESKVPCTPERLRGTADGGNTARLLLVKLTECMEMVDTKGFMTTGHDVCSEMKLISMGYGRFDKDMSWETSIWKRWLYPLFYDFTRKMDFAVLVVSADNKEYYKECKDVIKPITDGIGCAPVVVVTSSKDLDEDKRDEISRNISGIGAQRVEFVENYQAGETRKKAIAVNIGMHKDLCEVLETIQNDYDNHQTGLDEHRRGKHKSDARAPKRGERNYSYWMSPFIVLVIVWFVNWLPGLPPLRDCTDLPPGAVSGVYAIKPDDGVEFDVYCDMSTVGGGWTVFQRREDGSVGFYRNWANYKSGFGDVSGEHWLGNDNIHRLSSAGAYELRVDMSTFEGEMAYAHYDNFRLGDEFSNYKLLLGSYSGSAGDSFGGHRNSQFSTFDRDHDTSGENCAVGHKEAWWYSECILSNLNGLYLYDKTDEFGSGVVWQSWKGYNYSLETTEMKIRRLK